MENSGPPAGRAIIVRLTTKCIYKCKHCCFECGPGRKEVMPVEVAKETKECFEGHASWLNVMGGEITLLPHYPELLHELSFAPMRIVTNGWWVDHKRPREKLVSTVKELSKQKFPVFVGVSRDRFHPAGVGDRAFEWLRTQTDFNDDWGFTATKDPEKEERAVAPVGRAWWNELGDEMLRMFGTYCRSHNDRASMTVLEDGVVTYCPFGAWPMGYLDEGFEVLEKERLRIDKIWFSNCVSCWREWEFRGKPKWNGEEEKCKNV
jgi:hypothetical protein